MNTVIYARYSSRNQSEQSIEGQLRVCKEYAKKKGLTIINEYIDRGITGTADNRPEFLQMIEDSKRGQFEAVLVYKLDRFSRNHYDNAVYKKRLQQNNVTLLSATEAIDNSPSGILMQRIIEGVDEVYSIELSQKVKRGLNESFLKNNHTGGNILYGYKVIDRKIVIDEEKAPAIRYAFNEYANGKPKKQIVKELNDKGYRNNKGKEFTIFSFYDNFKNKKYIGEFNYAGRVSYDTYPAIIDKDIFEKVQIRIKQNKLAPARAKAKEIYLLSGKAFCGHCGENLIGTSGTGRSKVYYYYACTKAYKKKECDKKIEKKQPLEDYVVEQTVKYILEPKKIDKIASQLVEEYSKSINEKTIKDYEKRINKLNKEIDKCFDILLKVDDDELIERAKQKSKDFGLQKNDLQKELRKLKLASQIKHTKKDFIKYLSTFIEEDSLSEKYKKRIITYFVNSVYVFDDKILIYFNMLGNKPLTYEEMKSTLKTNNSAVRISSDELHQSKPPKVCFLLFKK